MAPSIRIVASLLVACAVGVVATPSAAQTAPTLTVTPDSDLADREEVTLDGTGFTASPLIGYCQGVFDETPDPTDCGGFIGTSSAGPSGEFSAPYTVHRFISVQGIGTVDCAQPSAGCAIGAANASGTNPVGPTVVTPISFAPQPPLSLTVTPGTGIVDGDVVLVEGTGFLPGWSVRLCQELDDQVSAEFECPTELDSVPTDEVGSFSVEYRVRRFVTPVGAGPTTDCAAVPPTCTMSASIGGFPPGPSIVTTIGFAPQPPVTVAAFGTVTGPTGEPLAGAQVWAYTPSDTWVGSRQTVTDAQGSYEFDELELDVPYRILFRPPSGSTLVSQWSNGSLTRDFAREIPLAAGEFVQADAQLGAGSSLSGSVSDTNGNPVAGVEVRAFLAGQTWAPMHVTSTGPDGTYLIGNVAPGLDFQVLFVPPAGSGLTTEWWDDAPAPRRRSAEWVFVAEAPTTGIDAQLEATGAISGAVEDTTGNPVPGVRVLAYGPNDRLGTYTASTGSDGTYSIGGVHPDDYHLVYSPPADSGLALEWYDDVATRDLATDVTVPAGQSVAGIDAQLAGIP